MSFCNLGNIVCNSRLSSGFSSTIRVYSSIPDVRRNSQGAVEYDNRYEYVEIETRGLEFNEERNDNGYYKEKLTFRVYDTANGYFSLLHDDSSDFSIVLTTEDGEYLFGELGCKIVPQLQYSDDKQMYSVECVGYSRTTLPRVVPSGEFVSWRAITDKYVCNSEGDGTATAMYVAKYSIGGEPLTYDGLIVTEGEQQAAYKLTGSPDGDYYIVDTYSANEVVEGVDTRFINYACPMTSTISVQNAGVPSEIETLTGSPIVLDVVTSLDLHNVNVSASSDIDVLLNQETGELTISSANYTGLYDIDVVYEPNPDIHYSFKVDAYTIHVEKDNDGRLHFTPAYPYIDIQVWGHGDAEYTFSIGTPNTIQVSAYDDYMRAVLDPSYTRKVEPAVGDSVSIVVSLADHPTVTDTVIVDIDAAKNTDANWVIVSDRCELIPD